MAEGEMARLFHRLTSIEPVSQGAGFPIRDVVADDPLRVTSFEPNDMALLPPVVKRGGLPGEPVHVRQVVPRLDE